jgi:hypothetical protein
VASQIKSHFGPRQQDVEFRSVGSGSDRINDDGASFTGSIVSHCLGCNLSINDAGGTVGSIPGPSIRFRQTR